MYKVILKKSYTGLTFTFIDWNCAADFIETVLLSADSDDEKYVVSVEYVKEEEDER